ncbi:MAG: hypothetical protein HY521_10390 [Proteobacteria bacterium]|nr:hypothetical protein [Pseudomonadota bacterium]
MDSLTFLIRLIEALAWPGVAVFIGVAFRNEFRALFPLVRKLKAGPLEAEFEREVQEISREAAGTPATEIQEAVDPRLQMLRDLARVNPRSAILEAWLDVESAVRKAALRRIASSPPPDVSSPVRTMRELVQYKAISPNDAALFQDLRGLRNQAAHLADFSPSHEAALNYVNLARQLESRLEGPTPLN